MKSPKYTDQRYPNGYTPAARTDIQAMFRRVRRETAEAAERKKVAEAETATKVRQFKSF